jgi:hypothetical protein
MSRPKNPTEKVRKRNHPSSRSKRHEADQDRSLPSRKSPTIEKQRERIVNEDEQLKAVNNREDNAQSPSPVPQEENMPAPALDNENERLEAGYDSSEVNPRPPKVV